MLNYHVIKWKCTENLCIFKTTFKSLLNKSRMRSCVSGICSKFLTAIFQVIYFFFIFKVKTWNVTINKNTNLSKDTWVGLSVFLVDAKMFDKVCVNCTFFKKECFKIKFLKLFRVPWVRNLGFTDWNECFYSLRFADVSKSDIMFKK